MPKKHTSGTTQTPADRQARGLRRVEFWWRADMVALLDEEAKARGVSRSKLVLDMLADAAERLP